MSSKIKDQGVGSGVADINKVTRISGGSEFRGGILMSASDIRIDGTFYGTIITKAKLILGEKAFVKGDVVCLNADIFGAMDGNITVGEVLSFKKTCVFSGAIKVQHLCVESGAKFDGTSQIITGEEYAQASNEMSEACQKQNAAQETL